MSIDALLNRPHFSAGPVGETNSQLHPDPAIPTRIKVTLDEIIPYSGNPRQSRNPKYDEIKESIRNSGLDHVPNITRQNPNQPYMIKDGGNTRLAILNELWLETNDRKFFEFYCVFYPWSSDFDILIKHMKENELRGDMLFIERSIAANRIKKQLEEQEQTVFSVRELSRRISLLGWTIDQSLLNQLLYAHEKLYPIIPQSFWGGMGRDGVKSVRKIIENAETYWDSVATQEEGSFDLVWQPLFMALDGEDFDVEYAQNELEAVVAERLNTSMMSVRGEIQAIATGVSKGGFRAAKMEAKPETQTDVGVRGVSKNAVIPFSPQKNEPVSKSKYHTDETTLPVTSNEMDVTGQPQFALNDLQKLSNYTTEELMASAFELATEYAAFFGFEICVELATDHDFKGHHGFHSGFVLVAPSREVHATFLANHFLILNYLYLFQLSSWCCDNHEDPAMTLVSYNKIKWISAETLSDANRCLLHVRSQLAANALKGEAENRLYSVMEKLETSVGILFNRCQNHLNNIEA